MKHVLTSHSSHCPPNLHPRRYRRLRSLRKQAYQFRRQSPQQHRKYIRFTPSLSSPFTNYILTTTPDSLPLHRRRSHAGLPQPNRLLALLGRTHARQHRDDRNPVHRTADPSTRTGARGASGPPNLGSVPARAAGHADAHVVLRGAAHVRRGCAGPRG